MLFNLLSAQSFFIQSVLCLHRDIPRATVWWTMVLSPILIDGARSSATAAVDLGSLSVTAAEVIDVAVVVGISGRLQFQRLLRNCH